MRLVSAGDSGTHPGLGTEPTSGEDEDEDFWACEIMLLMSPGPLLVKKDVNCLLRFGSSNKLWIISL
jgi:hypothetical protein